MKLFAGTTTVLAFALLSLQVGASLRGNTNDHSFEEDVMKKKPQAARRRLPVSGTETFLGIRVVATGCNPACSLPPTVAQIADDLYGDSINLVTVTNDCSYGEFTIGPASDINGVNLATQGVYEVTITDDVFNASISDTRAIVNAKLSEDGELGENFKDGADKFIYFFPPELFWPLNPAGNVAPGWGGGDSLNLNVGFYASTCGHVHEYFHTMGLNHATEGGRGANEYRDTTGQMGGSASGDEFCQKCFNGPHNWFLGWYEDRHDEITSNGILDIEPPTQTFELVGLSEYEDSTSDHTVVLKVGLGFPDYYVSFNRDTGINVDTGEKNNQVLIHTTIASADLSPASYTDLRQALNAGDTFPIPGGEIAVTNIDTSGTPGIATVEVRRVIPSGKLDVFFLIDDTGSFQDDIDLFKGIVGQVIADIQADGDDVHFGLGIFRDYNVDDYGEAGDFPYQRLVSIPADGDGDGAQAVIDATQALAPNGGGDAKESQLAALFQAVTGDGDGDFIPADQDANFRGDAAKFIVLWTDAGFHDSGVDGDYPGPSYGDTIDALQTAGVPFRKRRRLEDAIPAQSIRVVGIVRPGEDDFNDAVLNLKDLAEDTGAIAPPGGVDCGNEIIPEGFPIVCTSGTGEGIAPAMTAAVQAVIETIRPTALCDSVTVEAEEGKCYADFASIDDGSSDPGGDDITLEQYPDGPYAVGTNFVSLSVTNSQGLQSYCFDEIIVEDKEAPELLDVPYDTTVECDAVPKPANVWARDNCITYREDPPVVQFEEIRTDGDCEFEYTLDRTWTTQDNNGNEAEETQIIEVEDTTGPEIQCNVHDISPNDVNMQSPITFTATATDNCHDPEDLTVWVESYSCYKVNNNGKQITAQCKIDLVGDAAVVSISGGVGTIIELNVKATQPCGDLDPSEALCTVNVVLP